jgi:hypothetical protein
MSKCRVIDSARPDAGELSSAGRARGVARAMPDPRADSDDRGHLFRSKADNRSN